MDRGFTRAGFSVVSAGDAMTGQRIEEFHPEPGIFAGVIGGPPCQKFSGANRARDVEQGLELVWEFGRVVHEADADWFLMENVNGLPVAELPGMFAPFWLQALHLNAREFGFRQNRPRWFIFGSISGRPLAVPYPVPAVTHRGEPAHVEARCCLASEGKEKSRRAWADFVELQGLPRDFDFPPGLSTATRYRLIGNGVHVGVAQTLAASIQRWQEDRTPRRVCCCGCGREVPAGRTRATAACRKRLQRARDAAGVSAPDPDAAGASLELALS